MAAAAGAMATQAVAATTAAVINALRQNGKRVAA